MHVQALHRSPLQKNLSVPPSPAAGPRACCQPRVGPQPDRPRSGCALGPFAPRAAHGARKSTFTATGADGARLHRGCASRFASCSACPGSATRRLPQWPAASLTGAPCASRVTPGQRRTPYAWVGRAAGLRGSSARTRPIVQGGRHGAHVIACVCRLRACQLHPHQRHHGLAAARLRPSRPRVGPERIRGSCSRQTASQEAATHPEPIPTLPTSPHAKAPRTSPLPSPCEAPTYPCDMPS